MLGMCDELRDTAIMKLDQMIETLESSSNDADLKTPKRTLGETDLGQNSCPLRRVRARCKNGEALLDTTSEKAPQHGMNLPLLLLLKNRLSLTWRYS
jgi:hypothetical protein